MSELLFGIVRRGLPDAAEKQRRAIRNEVEARGVRLLDIAEFDDEPELALLLPGLDERVTTVIVMTSAALAGYMCACRGRVDVLTTHPRHRWRRVANADAMR
ncbi:hypothetical protein [Nocardia tengchongensis]|uniref:hypothetical protein n=1 Tax=Nocardia tengchongensis TaxID=2055889 RepID=UPI00367BF643